MEHLLFRKRMQDQNYGPTVQMTRLQICNNIGLIGPLLYIHHPGKVSPSFNDHFAFWTLLV